MCLCSGDADWHPFPLARIPAAEPNRGETPPPPEKQATTPSSLLQGSGEDYPGAGRGGGCWERELEMEFLRPQSREGPAGARRGKKARGQAWEERSWAGKVGYRAYWRRGKVGSGTEREAGAQRARPGARNPSGGWGGGGLLAPGPPRRAQATNLSARMCQWSRGSSCVSPDPVPSKHRGLPAPTTGAIAFLAWLGRPSSILPSPPFLLPSQLGQFSISIPHPLGNPVLPLAAGHCSVATAPTPIPHPPHPPPPPSPRSTLGFGAPLLGATYIRLAVCALGTRASTSVGVCRRNLTAPWGEQRRRSTKPGERSTERAVVRSHSGLRSTQWRPRLAQVWDPILPAFAEESSRGEYAVRMFFFKDHVHSPCLSGAAGDRVAPQNVSTQTLSRLHWLYPKTNGENKPSRLGFPGPSPDTGYRERWAADSDELQTVRSYRSICNLLFKCATKCHALQTDKRFKCATKLALQMRYKHASRGRQTDGRYNWRFIALWTDGRFMCHKLMDGRFSGATIPNEERGYRSCRQKTELRFTRAAKSELQKSSTTKTLQKRCD